MTPGPCPRRSGGVHAALAAILANLVLALLVPAPVRADGSQTGTIAGEVLDAGHVGLQGVEVRVSGPQITRSGLTDEQGRFRFPALGLGIYQVTAELLGLKATVNDVQVFIGKITEVRLRLGEATAEEPATSTPAAEPGAAPAPALPPTPPVLKAPPGTASAVGGESLPGDAGIATAHDWIQVLAEAPVIDRFDPRVGGNISFEFVDKLPVQRFYQSAAEVLPGIAGSRDGNPSSSGALRNENLFLIDGVDTTDPVTGLFGLNLAYEAIQEVSVTTAAAPVDFGGSSGAVINVVTRSGTNEYQGSARLLATDKGWNSRYSYPAAVVAQVQPELDAFTRGAPRLDPIGAVSLGGPLWRDHLWFFAAYENGQNTFFGPTHEGTLWNEGADLESTAIKGSWQVTPGATLVLQQTVDNATFSAFDPFNRGFAENRVTATPSPQLASEVDAVPGDIFALEKHTQAGSFTKGQLNTVFGQDLSLEATVAHQDRRLNRDTLNTRGLTGDAPHVAVTDFKPGPAAPEVLEVVLYNGTVDKGFEKRPREQSNAALTWSFSAGPTDHQLKLGADFQRTESERFFNFPGTPGIDPLTGSPVQGQLFVDLNQSPRCAIVRCPAFDPLSGTFTPFELFNFYPRAPRRTREQTLGLYLSDALVLGRFLVSAGARFDSVHGDDAQGGDLIDSREIAPRLAVTYDVEGNGTVLLTGTFGRYYEPFLQLYLDSFNEPDILSGYTQYTWAFADPTCASADPTNLASHCWAPDGPVDLFPTQLALPNRALRRSYVEELTVGFERQVTVSTGVSLHYIQRTWHDLWDNLVQHEDSPTSQILNLPFARRNHRAIQLLLQKRFADHWQLLGSYTRSRTLGNLFQNDGASTFADFSDVTNVNLVNRFGLAPYDRTHQVKLFGNYQVPFGGANLSFGSALLYESGVPFEMRELVPLGDSFGVRYLTPAGSDRTPWVFQLDLAMSGELRLGSQLALETKAEVFNVTNARQVLGVESVVNTGNFGKPRSILDLQAPRGYRLTLGFRF